MNLDSPTPEEFPFIFDTWARSWRNSPWSGTTRNCDYPEIQRKSSGEIVDRVTTEVVVLWTNNEAGARRLIGYIVYEPSRKVIHWLYVKKDWRGQGWARRLKLHAMGDDAANPREWVYTHKTKACEKLFRGMRHDKALACMQG